MALQPPIDVDWKAQKEALQIWFILKRSKGLQVSHVPRCQTDLADLLAKAGGSKGWDYEGYTYPIFKQ